MSMRKTSALVTALFLILGALFSTSAADAASAGQTRPWHLTSTEKWTPSDPSELAVASRTAVRVGPPPVVAAPPAVATATIREYALTLPGAIMDARDDLPMVNRPAFDAADKDEEAHCLALGLYHEARGEGELGQIAVAQVILNRVKSRKYPDNICDVVFENEQMFNACQFSFACDGRSDKPENWSMYQKMKKLADEVLCNPACSYHVHRDPPLARLSASLRKASHYHTFRVDPGWSHRINRVGQVGAHIFYISKRVWSL
jgi:hypothetical protein